MTTDDVERVYAAFTAADFVLVEALRHEVSSDDHRAATDLWASSYEAGRDQRTRRDRALVLLARQAQPAGLTAAEQAEVDALAER